MCKEIILRYQRYLILQEYEKELAARKERDGDLLNYKHNAKGIKDLSYLDDELEEQSMRDDFMDL